MSELASRSSADAAGDGITANIPETMLVAKAATRTVLIMIVDPSYETRNCLPTEIILPYDRRPCTIRGGLHINRGTCRPTMVSATNDRHPSREPLACSSGDIASRWLAPWPAVEGVAHY